MKIILFGLRRSGTTLAFNLFRRGEGLRCYYEPLHPNLVISCLPNDRKGVYSEYSQLGEELAARHNGLGAPKFDVTGELIPDSLTGGHLRYLDFLFASAENVLLQPVRVVYQLRQLRRHYPDAKFVWILRRPSGFIHSVMSYRSDLRTYRDAGLASSDAIQAQKKNILLRAIKGWNAFDNPWSQIAAANFIVQNRPFFQGLEKSPAWIKLMALWYDHYLHVTGFIRENPETCRVFYYEKACASEGYTQAFLSAGGLNCPPDRLSGLIDTNVLARQHASVQDLSDGEEMIQRRLKESGVGPDLSFRMQADAV